MATGIFRDWAAAEVAEFDDFGFAFVEGGEAAEGGVGGDDVGAAFGGKVEGFVEGGGGLSATAFLGHMMAGVVDEDLAHAMGGDAEEVGSAFPIGGSPPASLR